MKQLMRQVFPVFAVNAILSLIGFSLAAVHFGAPGIWLHPVTGTLWTILLFGQMVLAGKQNPRHKIVGRIALVVLGLSIYAAFRGIALGYSGDEEIPGSVTLVFLATGIATLVYASIGIAAAVNRKFEAHSTAMLLAGSVTMAAGIARLSGALNAMAGVPFQLTYSLSVLSMAYILWRWRPSQHYLIGSYVVLMGCVIFLR